MKAQAENRKFFSLPFLLAAIWLLLVLSLSSWWVIFSLQQLKLIKSLRFEGGAVLVRQQTMLVQEGLFLIGLLLAGGVALLSLVWLQRRRTDLLQQFFAAFTHEVKTSLASLRLQAESLEEDLADRPEFSAVSKRLVKDTVRLELQLENSLHFARADRGALYTEDLQLVPLIRHLEHQWPEMEFSIKGDANLKADRRVLESVFKNLFQNARVHGEATRIEVEITRESKKLSVCVRDNGTGFAGDTERLGDIFVRHTSRSGSGLGLYLVRRMVSGMKGEVRFSKNLNGGFETRIMWPEESLR